MPDEPPPYEVGYRKPPLDGRFRKGRSGNPAGRRRIKPTKSETIAKVRDELITITVDGQKRQISFFEALVRKVHATVLTKGGIGDLEKLARFYEKHGVAPEQERLAQAKENADRVMDRIMDIFDKTVPDDPPEE
jgi:hypothetical protein